MKTNLKFKNFLSVGSLTLLIFFTSCSLDDVEVELPTPEISNVEVGLNDNEIGVVGRDFHLNAEIIAGDKIDLVQVKIEPLDGETYESSWSFEKIWDEYKGTKNATIHKHFDIPEDAVEGNYSFTIIITDENCTKLQEKRKVTIYRAENLPVDPVLKSLIVQAKDDKRVVNNYEKGTGDGILKMNENTIAQSYIRNVKGDGKLIVVLINKKIIIDQSLLTPLIILKLSFGTLQNTKT